MKLIGGAIAGVALIGLSKRGQGVKLAHAGVGAQCRGQSTPAHGPSSWERGTAVANAIYLLHPGALGLIPLSLASASMIAPSCPPVSKGSSVPMRLLIWPKFALIAVVAVDAGAGVALAQPGSTGGNVGVNEKTISGSNSEPSPDRDDAKRHGREDQDKGRSSHRDGAALGNFDGTWSYIVVGTNCPGSHSGVINISAGRISASGVTGSVSASGAYHAVGVGGRGVVSTATGRLSGNTGGGSFRNSDGCVGRWTATKQ